MTEAEWLAGNDAGPMFAFLAGRGDARRWRLLSCACLREVGHLLADCDARTAFAVLQRWADGRASDDEIALGHARAITSRRYLLGSRYLRNKVDRRVFARMQGVSQALLHATLPVSNAEAQAAAVAGTLRLADPRDPAWERRISERTAWLLRDVFGNPFRPPDLPPGWLRNCAAEASAIARAIYEDRSFDELPVLADALEDAACPSMELIRHCREAGPHGRGCWAVEALTERVR